MSQSLEERLGYHADPRESGRPQRRTEPRLDLIRSKVDCVGKTVLDLGCSGGFFAFELAKQAKHVIAVDGDAEVIARNKQIQRDLGVGNIDFVHSAIDADYVRSLGPIDVTLMLSVYHHMLTQSVAYDWNALSTLDAAASVLEAIAEQTQWFVFEIGYPNEGYEWCARLPSFGANWDEHIIRTAFRGHYDAVEVSVPAYRLGWINRHVVSKLSTPYREDGLLLQRIKSVLKFDARDFRKLYFGRRAPR